MSIKYGALGRRFTFDVMVDTKPATHENFKPDSKYWKPGIERIFEYKRCIQTRIDLPFYILESIDRAGYIPTIIHRTRAPKQRTIVGLFRNRFCGK